MPNEYFNRNGIFFTISSDPECPSHSLVSVLFPLFSLILKDSRVIEPGPLEESEDQKKLESLFPVSSSPLHGRGCFPYTSQVSLMEAKCGCRSLPKFFSVIAFPAMNKPSIPLLIVIFLVSWSQSVEVIVH